MDTPTARRGRDAFHRPKRGRGSGLALLARSPVAMLTAMLGAVAAVSDVRRVTAPHPGFARAFGVAWERAVAPEQQTGMLQRRWTWHLPAAPEPRWQRDVPFGYRTDDRGFLRVVPEEAETVREIIENVAEGSTLYAEAKRLNDLGLATPGWRYGNGKRRPGAKL